MTRDQLLRDIAERYASVPGPMNERERRQWAAREALARGRGGITLVSQALHISPNTIKKGLREIHDGEPSQTTAARIRKPGGGRKRKQT